MIDHREEQIKLLSKQLKLPTFANYTDILRQAKPDADFSDLLLDLLMAALSQKGGAAMLDRAIAFAANAHSGQLRKGTNTPYIVHPMEAAAIVSSMTDDREVIAAAVLHDTLEDCEAVTYERLREAFGQRVADLVRAESEQKEADAAGSWRKRKAATIDHLMHCPTDAKMIALADKLSNMRAIARDYRMIGDRLWERFNQKDGAEHGWYYKSMVKCFGDLAQHAAYLEYCQLVATVFGDAGSFHLDPALIVDAGQAYEAGIKVDQDYEKALLLYMQAAEAGDWMAYNNIGWLYQNGFGCEKDVRTAIHAYEIAAGHGNDLAMVNLGNLYEFGRDVEMDYDRALMWYRRAAEAGSKIGRFNVANFYFHGLGVARDLRTAFEMFSELYREGVAGTAFYMGLYYEEGMIVEQDYEKAMEYFLEGAGEEDMYCCNQLGVMYGRGLGVEKDTREAMKWYRLAAIAGDTLARINLAALEHGEEISDDFDVP